MANDTYFILWQSKAKRLKYPLLSLWNESAVMTGQMPVIMQIIVEPLAALSAQILKFMFFLLSSFFFICFK